MQVSKLIILLMLNGKLEKKDRKMRLLKRGSYNAVI